MDPIPLSSLQHWLYCPRQCALIHNEQVWAENRFTAEGQLLHKKANEGPDEHRATGSILRALHVSSEKLGISGICDIVVKSMDGRYTPVEYKRGKPKSHRADEVQVCAQALCLEEIFQTEIPNALIFYGTTRRRTEVPLDQTLRDLTLATIAAVHEMKRSGITPLAGYDARKCDACSLIDLCQPKALRLKRGAAAWFSHQLASDNTTDSNRI
ncbi:MAG: CRISPR-associated protein Cas4 [Verrucomicrobia bacterium]|nr:MAG: CRISPR-associated protein Cas4 [Verrucomicrobiota bacterium]